MPTLTIYLIRSEYKTPAAAVEGSLSEYAIKEDLKQLGTLYIDKVKPHPPAWASLFDGLANTSDFGNVQSSSALYITEASGRLFAVAFGHGRHILKTGAYEDRFGLLVVINSLNSDELRSVDKRTFDTVDQNVRSQVSQLSRVTEFGIDIEKDLIRGITGQPSDTLFGTRMTGADSLTVSVDTTIASLEPLLSKYLQAFESDNYKASFGWIDQINQVSDTSPQKIVLDEMLVKKVSEARDNGGHSPGLWLAIPDVVDYAGIHRFRFTGSSVSHNDLHLPGFIKALSEDDKLTIDLLKRKLAFAVDDDGKKVGDQWPVYKCIHFEVDQGEDTYLLAAGKWFKIRTDFTKEIDEYFESIPTLDLGWEEYKHPSEGEYNKSVFSSSNGVYALMDAVDIPVGGLRDKIEFCDLYSKERELIHVKRYGASSLLGHLFNQGLVSGQHLRSHAGFAELVNKNLPDTHKIDLSSDQVPRDTSPYKIVFAIISEDQASELHIPFFAKVAFKHVCQRLKSFGFTKIYRSKISVEATFSKLEKAKKKAKKTAKKAAKTAQQTQKKVGGPKLTAAPIKHPGKKTIFKSSSVN